MSERRTSLVGGLLVAIGPVSMALYTPAMPTLVEAFATSEATVKLTLSLYFGGFAATQLVCGPLSDAFGRRRITVLFMLLYLAGSLIAVVAPTIGWLLAARLIQGIGASVGIATARAIVRDQFTGERSARIMTTISIILAIGPALSPTIGGLALHLSGWHAIFVVMVLFGLGIIAVALLVMKETAHPDPALIRPARLLRSYRRILGHPVFVASALTLGGSVGTLYTLATILPFVLIGRAGLSPAEFGLGMLGQSGMFLAGSLALRLLMRRRPAQRLVGPGLVLMAAASVALVLSTLLVPPTYLSIMAPIGVYAFGIALVIPAMTTAALAPFPTIAGAASAALGFIQMSLGLLGGLASAALPNPVAAVRIVVPALALVAIAGFFVHRRLAAREGLKAEPDLEAPET
ncbi:MULTISPECIES: multidrug effflux MFS transporter [unclassified Aureimonas]|uniref:multidrug effflux MFS transporter n=1 Tax=unclassified Aureimonas TaxID=2615206 RepID=UPI0006FB0F45|nr:MULTISPECIES: multidrug effflux MFS transporter [unclassified Aureimonas]KQT65806.1 multidrug transporter CflA [Aureimonas sp. Leaf427]KQT74806.1 multidrug transporter CflA [Aureimonas sp. Leaf460]